MKNIVLDTLPQTLLKEKVLFVSGIDTNIGKTYATAALANTLLQAGNRVITQKMIQTGCTELSEDIEKHRELMGMPLLDIDRDGTTSPVILSYPSSPHLAARIDGREIELHRIEAATEKLTETYDNVLLEGAGGLMVPIREDGSPLGGYLTIDYIRDRRYPVVLVTGGRLGSLNHTLLCLDACRTREIRIALIVYNLYPDTDPVIARNSLEYLRNLHIPLALLDAV